MRSSKEDKLVKDLARINEDWYNGHGGDIIPYPRKAIDNIAHHHRSLVAVWLALNDYLEVERREEPQVMVKEVTLGVLLLYAAEDENKEYCATHYANGGGR